VSRSTWFIIIAIIVMLMFGFLALIFGGSDEEPNATDETVVTTTTETTVETTDYPPADSSTGDENISSPSEADGNVAIGDEIVDIKNFLYTPSTVTIKTGSMVKWINQEDTLHDVTPDAVSEAFPRSQTLYKTMSYSVRFFAPGTYRYHCSLHPEMTGMVIVTQ
jgi:plastocyanin